MCYFIFRFIFIVFFIFCIFIFSYFILIFIRLLCHVNTSSWIFALSLTELFRMEASVPSAAEKKDCKTSALDGNGFSELPKKPSPSSLARGTNLSGPSQLDFTSCYLPGHLNGIVISSQISFIHAHIQILHQLFVHITWRDTNEI